jgi:hypothetical protein
MKNKLWGKNTKLLSVKTNAKLVFEREDMYIITVRRETVCTLSKLCEVNSTINSVVYNIPCIIENERVGLPLVIPVNLRRLTVSTFLIPCSRPSHQ